MATSGTTASRSTATTYKPMPWAPARCISGRALFVRGRVDVVDPVHFFRSLDHRDVEIHHHRLLTAAAEHARERLAVARVDLLVWHIRRHVDEIARAGLGDELEL